MDDDNWERERRLDIAYEQEPRRFRRYDPQTAAESAQLKSASLGLEPHQDPTDAELLYAFDAIAALSKPAFVTFMTSQWPRGFRMARAWADANGWPVRQKTTNGQLQLDVFRPDETVWPLFTIMESK